MGLARYTAWLMLAARLAIGAQAQGIIQAALVEAETYARQREQFGKPIRELPQVAAMLADLHMLAQASRAVLYAVSEVVDLHQGAEARGLREETRRYGRWAEALTPIAKYYTTEVANRIVYDALQIHGGNGFMQEYPIERLYRDVRITNIYEGTSQIQINWAIPRLVRGDLDDLITAMAAHAFADADLARLQEEVNRCHEIFRAVIGWLRDKDVAFREMVGPQNVLEFEPTMGSEDFAYMLQAKPGAYCFIANGDGAHREMGHGAGPCQLHNTSYDFNDDLIALGATYWVRLAEAWFQRGGQPA